MGNFMVYQDRFQTNLLQLFAQQENLKWFPLFSAIIGEVNIIAEKNRKMHIGNDLLQNWQKKAYW